jgi:hypothetical protein
MHKNHPFILYSLVFFRTKLKNLKPVSHPLSSHSLSLSLSPQRCSLLTPHLLTSRPHLSTSQLSPHFLASPSSLSLSIPFTCCPSLPRSYRRLKARSHTAEAPKPSISPSSSLRLSDLSTLLIQK